MPSKFPSKRPTLGGQAVLEGVMMRGPASFAVVVRRQDGTLHVRERAAQLPTSRLTRLPLVRGVVTLIESLRMGREALQFSATQMEADLAIRAKATKGPSALALLGVWVTALVTRDDDAAPSSADAARSGRGGGALLALAIAFFVALPQGAAAALNRLLHLGLPVQAVEFQAITGMLKLVLVVGYLLAIRRIPEIRTVFQYHGAEHKAIATYEAHEPLAVDNARRKTTLHPRCGTTFLVMVALVSIVVFTFVGSLLPRIATGSAVADNLVFFVEKLPFLPVIVAITFELQRLFASRFASGPMRVLLWPGFLVQKITTAEPTDAQLEVALASLRIALLRGDAKVECAVENELRFPSYAALLDAGSLGLVAQPVAIAAR
jgi:uncharacterized protein YqhQ